MRRVEGPDVVVGVDPALEVEVVVDHVVGGVRDHEPDDREGVQPQFTLTSRVSRIAPTASSPPISPEVTVIEKTAARVITSHLEIASGVGHPLGQVRRVQHVTPRGQPAEGRRGGRGGRGGGVGATVGLVAMAWGSGVGRRPLKRASGL